MKNVISQRYLWQLLLLYSVYVATGILGLKIQAVNTFASLIWLPAGIALTVILLGGYRLWPAIFLGALTVNMYIGATLFVAIGIAFGNTLEAIIACFILKYFIGFQKPLQRNADLLGLTLLAAPIGSAISATIGCISLYFGNMLEITNALPTWTAWWTGNLLSDLIVVPFILLWNTPIQLRRPTVLRTLEAIAVMILLFLSCLFLFTDALNTRRTYIIFPPLIWIALRFGQRATITAIVIMSLFAVVATFRGIGPFVSDHLTESLLYLQTFMGTVALTSMILATIIHENKQIEKRKDEFINIASHELKTPLTSIGMFLQLLKKMQQKKKDKQTIEIIDKTDRQIKNMTKLVSELLDLSKMQMGRLELHKERFSLDDTIQTTVDSIQRISPTHTIILQGQAKKRIYADKERITQVLTNLITNAIKYSPNAKKVIVSVYATKLHITVGVQDFGIGIATPNQEKIFERFFRVKDTSETNSPGFGLGLSIAKEIIVKHHGKLFVQSSKGKGSTFFFSLPLTRRLG